MTGRTGPPDIEWPRVPPPHEAGARGSSFPGAGTGPAFDLTGTLRSILEGEGYRTESCSNGRAALEQVKAGRPDMILLDVMLPFMSGLEVLRAMKQTAGLDGIPVVLMSSVPPGVKQKDYRWEAFLRKPFSLEELLKVVHEQVGGPGALPDASGDGG
jgi:CheY-like chemotaxis protein